MGKECSRREAILKEHTIRLRIVAEGQTEETFARDVLSPYFSVNGIDVVPYCLITSVSSRTQRGGMVPYRNVKRDILRSLKEKSAYVTTMFYLYKLPHDFPEADRAKGVQNPYEKVKILEDALKMDIDNYHFIPYIQVHEFEALLFSDISCIDAVKKVRDGSHLDTLQEISRQFPNPELIDEGESTAPSKRLLSIYPSYQKVTDGILISKSIDLATIRSRCLHFDEWLGTIEHIL